MSSNDNTVSIEGLSTDQDTILSNGRWQPLRINHNPDVTYTVIYYPEQEVPMFDRRSVLDLKYHQRYPFLYVLFISWQFCLKLHQDLEEDPGQDRMVFLKRAANAHYYSSMAMKEIKRLFRIRVRVQVDGKDPKQMLEKLHQNICWRTLNVGRNLWVHEPSTLYIVLPSNSNLWIDSDPSTHCFRLYFLCDNWRQDGALENISQHVHLINHPGYVVKRTQEFFQIYGDHLLRLLLMVKHGYTDSVCEIPPLHTFKIFWNCDPDIVGHHLTKETLGPLVDKAIAYLQGLSLPTRNTQLSPTRHESHAIKTFLDLLEGESKGVENSLNRYITSKQTVLWICHSHMRQNYGQSALKELKEFIFRHKGHVDMHHSTLRVELASLDKANQFRTLLAALKFAFDIFIKLSWRASRSYVKDLCLDIAKTGTAVLEIDGITFDISPQGYVQYSANLFSEDVMSNDGLGLQLIILLNYPRPQEQYLHFRHISLQSAFSQAQLSHSWVDLRDDLYKFRSPVSEAQVALDSNKAVDVLRAVLEKYGLPNVIMVTFHYGRYDAVLDLEKRAIIEVSSWDMECPKAILSAGSLRRMTVDLDRQKFDRAFFHMLRTNSLLQELNISYGGQNVLYHAKQVVKIWSDTSKPLLLTLLDRTGDNRGRVIAQLTVNRGNDRELSGNRAIGIHGGDIDPMIRERQRALGGPVEIHFLKWDCDHISSQLSDYYAALLDITTLHHPSSLSQLRLNVFGLSRCGLSCVERILRQSCLEHLHIVCTPAHRRQFESITKVLGSVQWPRLRSLILSGDSIDAWIKLWPTHIAPQLLYLQIQGTGSAGQELSHSSTLFIHQLIYNNLLMELHLEHIHLQNKSDWMFLVESLDPELQKTFHLDGSSYSQFISTPDAVEIFRKKFPWAEMGRGNLAADHPSTMMRSLKVFKQKWLSRILK